MRRIEGIFIVFMVITGAAIILDVGLDNISIRAKAGTLYVGSGPGNDSTTIQGAINLANPGDTVFVHAGQYNEGLTVPKTLTLIGEGKNTTIIKATGKTYGIEIKNSDYVNISGFNVTGANSYNVKISSSNHSRIQDNILRNALFCALGINPGHDNLVENNLITNNLHGILISVGSSGNILTNNHIISCGDKAVDIEGNAHDNIISYNSMSGYNIGIYNYESQDNLIENNLITDGNDAIKIFDQSSATLLNNVISENDVAVSVFDQSSATIINCTMQNSDSYDITVGDSIWPNGQVTLINTSFDNQKASILDDSSKMTVKWYLALKAIDEDDQHIPDIGVRIMDNQNGSYDENYTTDSEGYIRWIPLTQYEESITGRIYFTPYNITAHNLTARGYAFPEVKMDRSKDITIKVFLDNLPPEIEVIEPSMKTPIIKEGSSLKFTIEASDPDPEDPLQITWYVEDTEVQVGGSSYTYYADYTAAGMHVVSVIVDDGTDSVEYSWNLTVEDASPESANGLISDQLKTILGTLMIIIWIVIVMILVLFLSTKRKRPRK